MELFTLELTVANRCGVLNRITGLYAKCKHNIETLSVHGSGDPALSVMRPNPLMAILEICWSLVLM